MEKPGDTKFEKIRRSGTSSIKFVVLCNFKNYFDFNNYDLNYVINLLCDKSDKCLKIITDVVNFCFLGSHDRAIK